MGLAFETEGEVPKVRTHGAMEYWSTGVMEKWIPASCLFQYDQNSRGVLSLLTYLRIAFALPYVFLPALL